MGFSAHSSEKMISSDSGYRITFPEQCDVNGLFSSHIGVCPKFAVSEKAKKFTALLPLFVIIAEKEGTQKTKTKTISVNPTKLAYQTDIMSWSQDQLLQDAAYFICGSSSLAKDMTPLTNEKITIKGGGVGYKLNLTCPADDYGVIGQRAATYLIITAHNMRYRVGVRFPMSQEKQLAEHRQNFIESLELTRPLKKDPKKGSKKASK